MQAEYWTECWKRKTKINDGEIEQKDLSRRWWAEVGGECTPLLDEIPFGCGEQEFFRRIGHAIDQAPTKEVWVKPNSGCGVHMRFRKTQQGTIEPRPLRGYDQWLGYDAWERLCKTKYPKYAPFVRCHLVEPILESMYHVNYHVVDGEIRLILVHCVGHVGSYQHGRRMLSLPVLGSHRHRVGVPYSNQEGDPVHDYVSRHFERSSIDVMQAMLTEYKARLAPQFRGAFRVDFMAFPDGRLLHTGDGTTNIRNVTPCDDYEDNAVRTLCFCDKEERAEAAVVVCRCPELRELLRTWISPWEVYDRKRGWRSSN